MEILSRRGGPVDETRGRRRAVLGDRPPIRDLVACLVEPYAALLATAEGRSYLRIVDQLRGTFAAWRVESDAATTRHLAVILDEIESRAPGDVASRREGVVGLIVLLTGMVAERARRIDERITNDTTDEEFTEHLVAMCTAVVTG